MANEPMTPSEDLMTREQSGKLLDMLEAVLRKLGIRRETMQAILTLKGRSTIVDMVTAFQMYAEMYGSVIIKYVNVDASRTVYQILEGTHRKQYLNPFVVEKMPRSSGKQEIFFFEPRPESYDEDGQISDGKLEEEYDFLGLEPAEPDALAKANEDDPGFADRPNATIWKDADGNWCYAMFSNTDGVRQLVVNQVFEQGETIKWSSGYLFAGRKKRK